VIQKIWRRRHKDHASNPEYTVWLEPTEQLAAQSGMMYVTDYVIDEVELDVVFLIRERGDHYDGGDTIIGVAERYEIAQKFVDGASAAKRAEGYTVYSDTFEIDIYEILR
jgi:hypothetical protein